MNPIHGWRPQNAVAEQRIIAARVLGLSATPISNGLEAISTRDAWCSSGDRRSGETHSPAEQ